jgi:hypothetical protein
LKRKRENAQRGAQRANAQIAPEQMPDHKSFVWFHVHRRVLKKPERSSYTLRTHSETWLRKKCFGHQSKRRILPDSKQKTNSLTKTGTPNDVRRIFFGSVKARSAISTVVLKTLWKRTVRAS